MEKIIKLRPLGYRIKMVREERHYSVDDFAEILDISSSHVKNIESASSYPSADVLVRISNATGVSLDQLLVDSLTGKSQRDGYVEEYIEIVKDCSAWEVEFLNDFLRRLIVYIRNLSWEEK